MTVEATSRPDDVVEYFLSDLRSLRVAAGAPSYRALERATGLARSTLHDALNGSSLPALGTTITLVVALGADPDPWRERWVSVRSGRPAAGTGLPETEVAAGEPVAALDDRTSASTVQTDASSAAAARSWARPRVLVAIGVAAVLAGSGTWAVAALSRPTCTPVALYRLTDDSRLLTSDGTLVTRVTRGQLLVVSSVDHGTFRYRFPARLLTTGEEGYVDQGKIEYVSGTCAENPTAG